MSPVRRPLLPSAYLNNRTIRLSLIGIEVGFDLQYLTNSALLTLGATLFILYFFLHHTFKRFSFCSAPQGLEPRPSGHFTASVLSTYTSKPNLCYLTSQGVRPLRSKLYVVAYFVRLYTHYSVTLYYTINFFKFSLENK